jgi:hypothetical protein
MLSKNAEKTYLKYITKCGKRFIKARQNTIKIRNNLAKLTAKHGLNHELVRIEEYELAQAEETLTHSITAYSFAVKLFDKANIDAMI